ncbi:hypothetical protein V8G54_004231, partial [Vigna mungo]
CNQLDRDSLLAFSRNISTPSPLNWSASVDCCLWEGIKCDDNFRVIYLLLPSRGLAGFIFPSLTNLTALSLRDLSQNRLSGNLQDQFFSLLNHQFFSPLLLLRTTISHLITFVQSSTRIPKSQSVNPRPQEPHEMQIETTQTRVQNRVLHSKATYQNRNTCKTPIRSSSFSNLHREFQSHARKPITTEQDHDNHLSHTCSICEIAKLKAEP